MADIIKTSSGNVDNFYLQDSFIESPIYDNWFKRHYPQKSLLICSPYIKKDAIDKIIDLYALADRSSDFELKILIRGNTEEFTYQKSSDAAVFDSLIALNGLNLSNIRRISNLHMKAYLIDEKHLLITSGNMTNSGMFVISGRENFEGGISSNDANVIFSFLQYFSGIWKQSEALEDFYDTIMSAYTKYIENEYSDKGTLQRLNSQRYCFRTYTAFSGLQPSAKENARREKETRDETANRNNGVDTTPTLDILLAGFGKNISMQEERQIFSLSDIPPVGRPEHLPATLQIISNASHCGITPLELGKKLRPLFSSNASDTDYTNRKFGEEKGKFAAFLGFVSVARIDRRTFFKINNLGKAFLQMTEENRNKLIKDIFFDKPIVVSILRHSLDDENFDLLNFLSDNCRIDSVKAAKHSTLARKVSPLKELFSLVRNICTESELRKALERV